MAFDVKAAVRAAKMFEIELKDLSQVNPQLVDAIKTSFSACVDSAGLKIAGRILMGRSVDSATAKIKKYGGAEEE